MGTFELLKEFINNSKMFFVKQESVNGRSAYIMSYNYFNPVEYKELIEGKTSNNAFYDLYRTFGTEFVSELRGLTYVEGRFFPSVNKFFNVGELVGFKWADIPDRVELISVEKVDGSLIIPVIVGGKLRLKTKNSFFSMQAKEAMRILAENKKLQAGITDMIKRGYFPLFEYVSPLNRIVVKYPKEELVLIAVRKQTDELKFQYVNPNQLSDIARELGVRAAEVTSFIKEELIRLQNEAEGIEGYVVYFAGSMMKVKTKWYFERHKLNAQNLREDLILEFVLKEEIDDILPALSKDIRPAVSAYASRIINKLNEEVEEVAKIRQLFETVSSPKEFAVNYPKYVGYIRFFISGVEDKDIVKRIWLKRYKKLSAVIRDFGKLRLSGSAAFMEDIVYNIFGSKNSTDLDVAVKLPFNPDIYSTDFLHALAKKLESKIAEEVGTSKPVNVNFVYLEDGVVAWSFKGIPDELNNAIYKTYHLHKQIHPLFVERMVTRDADLKARYILVKLLTFFTRSAMRLEVKEALREGSARSMAETLERIVQNQSYDEYVKNIDKYKDMSVADFGKKVAFYILQNFALRRGKEIYDKDELAAEFPEYAKLLRRQADAEEVAQKTKRLIGEFANLFK